VRILNPATGEHLRDLPDTSAAAVAEAHDIALSAQPAWAARPLDERRAVVARFRDLIAARSDALAATLTSETGKPISQARNELAGVLPRIDFFLEATGPTLEPTTVFHDDGLDEVITHEPLGVVANISAWNYPWFVGTNAFIPALLTGNAVLYKPSEYASLTGLAMADLLHEAGVPPVVFQALLGGGDTGAALLDQPLDGLFFTGSYPTGRRIAERVAGHLLHLQLELGGKDPVYVTDDVDVAVAAEGLADGAFYNTGQSCCSVERIYVHRAVHDDFVEHFVKAVEGFVVGDPNEDETYIGPLTRPQQIDVLEHQVADARQRGAHIRLGGERLDRPGGAWFAPTVITEATAAMDVMRTESFGPIIGIQVVDADDEALALMADTDYGLTAGVYSRDRERATAILQQVDAGSVYWNCCDRVSPRLPWSGRGHSGVGATLSTLGITAFTRPKAWHLRRG
jgi:acyl-CoA reductase-like NAD-dependent aldehyde dehydrogenase